LNLPSRQGKAFFAAIGSLTHSSDSVSLLNCQVPMAESKTGEAHVIPVYQ
jgi:hypothetical protein